jgi:hypothetical protein
MVTPPSSRRVGRVEARFTEAGLWESPHTHTKSFLSRSATSPHRPPHCPGLREHGVSFGCVPSRIAAPPAAPPRENAPPVAWPERWPTPEPHARRLVSDENHSNAVTCLVRVSSGLLDASMGGFRTFKQLAYDVRRRDAATLGVAAPPHNCERWSRRAAWSWGRFSLARREHFACSA